MIEFTCDLICELTHAYVILYMYLSHAEYAATRKSYIFFYAFRSLSFSHLTI